MPKVPYQNPSKYKTIPCRHYNSPGGCNLGDKCNFAHGNEDLRPGGKTPLVKNTKKSPNLLKFKTQPCKYYQPGKEGSCRYGSQCVFAHGDSELRTMEENQSSMQINPLYMNPSFVNPSPVGFPFYPNFPMPQFDPNFNFPQNPISKEELTNMFMKMSLEPTNAEVPMMENQQPIQPVLDNPKGNEEDQKEDK